ncbi:MAG TPA: DUF2804 family protein [Kofleriaceae bacterium]|nr:DUF2804 family protein [Kofleriaceae bacterium]
MTRGQPLAAGYDPPPTELVVGGRQQLGRFHGPPPRANLLDAKVGHWPRLVRSMRLKQWQAMQLQTPRLFVNLALFDVRLMGLRQAKVYDRERHVKHLHERKLPPGSLHLADQLLDSTNRHADRVGHLEFRNRVGAGAIDVSLDLAASGDAPAMRGDFTVHVDRGAQQIVSLPFRGDVGMYSTKGLFPVTGELEVAGELHRFAPGDTLALLDDHKGYYPYVMAWDWVTSARFVDGVACGFNLTRNQVRDPDRYNENCGWRGDRIGRLPPVTFERERARQAGELWRIRDPEGRVELTFEPTVPGDVDVNAVIVKSRYRGPFGTFHGRLSPEGLAPISVDGWFGMGEQFWLRC